MSRISTRWARRSTLLGVGVLLTALLGTPAATAALTDDAGTATTEAAAVASDETAGASTGADDVAPAANGTPISEGTGLYPRAIRLAHNGDANGRILASTVTFDDNNGIGAIHESTDNGASFRQVGAVADPDSSGGQGLCCATLYELPQQVGDLRAGTLLWASSAGQDETDRRMALRIWASDDIGRSWDYLSSCVVASGTGGLWEPEFSVAADGALVCHYADETDPAHNQKLAAARSYDGVNWVDHKNTVASTWEPDRPGMPVVRKLPNGTYFMIFEICNPGGQYQCVVHYRTSPDGWDWGDPAHLGFRPETADGKYLRAAPTVAWSPAPDGNPNGQLVIVGQMVLNADGSTAPENGQIVLVNNANGEGPWRAAPAPVQVPTAEPNYCPNYSSPLLPSDDGRELFQIATDWDGDVCRAYFATGSL
ncbi:sialidase family protein [Streptomyces triticirhizae]|uniref:Exo-alpha-sialidase n=1 Tax=Streptomyces triticirhizae TaxID=2483353 RepID=A0A3M2LAW3_9ACTN|nr:sialidase family protein [Streptomyces triticirhizae]RMI34721.1 exo-alpha-sialidase [Streptomyces triticirhizae]